MDRTYGPWATKAITHSSEAQLLYNQVISYPKTVLLDEPAFTVRVNLVQPEPGILMTFIHLDVYDWSLSTLKRLKEVWPSLRRRLPPIVFAQGDITDKKWVKCVRQFGFEPLLDDCPCDDGKTRHIYAHYI